MAKSKPKIKPKPKPKGKSITPPKRADRKPNNWDKVVNAAYLRLLGISQEQSAKRVGCSRKSIQLWEKKTWWPDATAEARERWLADGDAAAMRAHLKLFELEDDRGVHTRWALGHRFQEFKPKGAKIGFGFGGDDDGDDDVSITVSFVGDDE